MMQTLTVTKARQNLGGWLKKAVAGEEIGVILGDRVIALRPVPVVAADYAETEYEFSPREVDDAAVRITAAVRAAAVAGDVVEFKPGMLSSLENSSHKAVSRVRAKAKRG